MDGRVLFLVGCGGWRSVLALHHMVPSAWHVPLCAQHSCRCTGALIRASSAVSWLQQAKGGWLDARVDGIPLSSQGIHRADHT